MHRRRLRLDGVIEAGQPPRRRLVVKDRRQVVQTVGSHAFGRIVRAVETEAAVAVVDELIDECLGPAARELRKVDIHVVVRLHALRNGAVAVTHAHARLGRHARQRVELCLRVALEAATPRTAEVAVETVRMAFGRRVRSVPHLIVVRRPRPARMVHVVMAVGVVGIACARRHQRPRTLRYLQKLQAAIVALRPHLARTVYGILPEVGVGLHRGIEVALHARHGKPRQLASACLSSIGHANQSPRLVQLARRPQRRLHTSVTCAAARAEDNPYARLAVHQQQTRHVVVAVGRVAYITYARISQQRGYACSIVTVLYVEADPDRVQKVPRPRRTSPAIGRLRRLRTRHP